MGPPPGWGHTGSMIASVPILLPPTALGAPALGAPDPDAPRLRPPAQCRVQRTRGVTLAEIATVLVLAGVALGMALPLTSRALDRWAVRAARDEALALLHRARMEARLAGGARLEIRLEPAAMAVFTGDSLVAEWSGGAEGGVRIDLPGDRLRDELWFDALGLGVVTSRTLVFRRGPAEARLVISSRGRARRP